MGGATGFKSNLLVIRRRPLRNKKPGGGGAGAPGGEGPRERRRGWRAGWDPRAALPHSLAGSSRQASGATRGGPCTGSVCGQRPVFRNHRPAGEATRARGRGAICGEDVRGGGAGRMCREGARGGCAWRARGEDVWGGCAGRAGGEDCAEGAVRMLVHLAEAILAWRSWAGLPQSKLSGKGIGSIWNVPFLSGERGNYVLENECYRTCRVQMDSGVRLEPTDNKVSQRKILASRCPAGQKRNFSHRVSDTNPICSGERVHLQLLYAAGCS